MTPPIAFKALLTGQAPFGGWQSGTALCVDFIVAGYAGSRTFFGEGCTRRTNTRFPLLFGAKVGLFKCEIPELQSGRPTHLAKPSLTVWPPM